MRNKWIQNRRLATIIIIPLVIFIGRTWLASSSQMPILFDLFDTLTLLGALWVLFRHYRNLTKADWITAFGLGLLIGVLMLFASLFNPYPFFWTVQDRAIQAVIRAGYTTLAALGGLVVMRQGGPVQFHIPALEWRKVGPSLLAGLFVGIPLAGVNVIALKLTQGQAISWQPAGAAFLDALLPGVVEEVIYRFAAWGILWMLLNKSLSGKKVWVSGLLATFIHSFAHFSDLFVEAPLVGLGMGLGIGLIWGLPPLLLARKRGLEAAISFHWMVDAVRFLTGF